MDHGRHSYLIMIGLVVAGAVLLLTDNAGGPLLLLWPFACMANGYRQTGAEQVLCGPHSAAR